MRAVIQRVSWARVKVGEEVVGEIDRGLLIFLGVGLTDTEADAERLAEKCVALRIFENKSGKFDRSLRDIGGKALVVSQFTLYGDARRGRRPDFTQAARPEKAKPLYERFVRALAERDVSTATGRFAAMMRVELENDGPVTLFLDTVDWK